MMIELRLKFWQVYTGLTLETTHAPFASVQEASVYIPSCEHPHSSSVRRKALTRGWVLACRAPGMFTGKSGK